MWVIGYIQTLEIVDSDGCGNRILAKKEKQKNCN